ncbi:hypothetical protein GCM10007978_19370 [Shewanella hanedai]|uniref:Tape measure protein n=1 Tax=Shewanella hanedai TaxID=25 RepID=A0A553JDW8_SHEHA|nr:tape measure protein [Shewanella hanedai]TRY10633.1 tape measure protein [Shewanella hanedai]GGI81647.1 hypothetical protein GCM10007978_19370 [Shewanella hanedai]
MGDLKLALTLTADGKQLIGTVKGAASVVSDLNTRLNHTQSSGNKAAQGLSKVQRQGDAAGKSLKRMGSYAVGAFAGLSAINLGQKITQDLAAFQDIRTRLQSLSGTTAAYAANEEYLMQVTRAHHKELIPLADNYAALLNLQEAGLVTQAQARTLLEGMSNAQSALGASSNQLGQSMYGLSQALDMPIINAENFNQVVEPLPGLLNKLTKASGAGAGGFRQLVIDGKVTSTFFRDTLIKALGEYDGAAAATAANISAQSRDMKNAYQQLIVAFETPINSSLTPVLSTLTEGLMWSTDNAELLIDVLGGALVIAMSRASATAVSAATASLSKARADGVARAAAISGAQAELQKAMAQRKGVLTSGQAVVADARLTAARGALTAATNRATFATRAMNGAMSLVGGPVGVVMMTAAALGTMAYQAYTAEDGLNKVAAAAAKVGNPFADYSKDMLERARLRLSHQVEMSQQALEEMEQRFANPNPNLPRSLAPTVEQLSEARKKAAALAVELKSVQTLLSSSKETGLTNKINKTQQQLLENLTKQKMLYGETSEAAKVRYEIEHGALKQLDPAINAQILLEAKALDAKKKAAAGSKEAADAIKEQDKNLKSLLAVLDPLTAASNEMADKERLLKTYFEQTNVPLERRQALLAALKEEYAAPQETSEFEQLRGNLDPTFSENQNHSENLGILNDELQNTPESEAVKRNQINMLIEAEQQRHASAMTEINGGVSTQFDAMWSQTFDRFASGIGSATADALFESENFGDAMMGIGKGALKSVVSGLVELGTKKLAMAVIDKGIMASTSATATTTAATTGASITASMTPAAMTSSIASFGGSSVAGMAAMMAAMALIPTIIGQFHGGGTVPREGTYLLDGGETVYTRKQQQTLMNTLSRSANGSEGGKGARVQVMVKLIEDASKAGSVEESKGLNGQDVINIWVANILERGQSAQVLEQSYGLQRNG